MGNGGCGGGESMNTVQAGTAVSSWQCARVRRFHFAGRRSFAELEGDFHTPADVVEYGLREAANGF